MKLVGVGDKLVEISAIDWDNPWALDVVMASANSYLSAINWVSSQNYLTANQPIWHDNNLSGLGSITNPLGLNSAININNKFTIDANGNVSAAGKISANGVELGPGGGGNPYTGDGQGALDQVYAHSGEWNDVYNTVNTASGSWAGGGDPEVNQVVYQYSAAGQWLTAHQSLSAYLTKASADTLYQPIGDYATNADLEQVSGDITGLIPDVSDFITNASAEVTYQPIGNYASASDITGFATKNELETTSGEIVSLIPSTAGLATETDLQIVSGGVDYVSGALTGFQPVGSYATTGQLDTASSFLSGAVDYISANAGTTYTGVAPIVVNNTTKEISADIFDLSAGDGISITALDNKIRIDVTAQGGDAEVNQVVHSYSANGTWLTNSDLNGYATTTDLENVSGDIVSLIPSTAGLATETLVENTSADIVAMIPSTAGLATETDLQIVSGGLDFVSGSLTGYQPIGDYATTGDLNSTSGILSGAIDYISGVAVTSTDGLATTGDLVQVSSDITGMIPTDYYTTSNPSGFITNISAENTYQTITGMTAYQPVGSYATTTDLEQVSGDITALIPSTAGLATESDLQIVSGGVDYISGAFTGYQPVGDYATTAQLDTASSFLSGAIDYVSGHGGGGGASYTAGDGIDITNDVISVKSTDLLVNAPLFTGYSGTSAFIGCNNETVLWSASTGQQLNQGITLNESRHNFEKLGIYYTNQTINNANDRPCEYFVWPQEFGNNATGTQFRWGLGGAFENTSGDWFLFWNTFGTATDDFIQSQQSYYMGISNFTGQASNAFTAGSNASVPTIFKIVGINRKS